MYKYYQEDKLHTGKVVEPCSSRSVPLPFSNFLYWEQVLVEDLIVSALCWLKPLSLCL